MKQSTLLLILLFASHLVFGQTDGIRDFYNKYKNAENVTGVKLQGWIIKLAATFTDDPEEVRLLRKISQLRILNMENGNIVSRRDYDNLISSLHKDRFEDLMMVKESGQNIQFLIREKGETITNLMILVSGAENFIMLSLEGALKFSDLNDLNIDIQGAEHFKKLPEDKKDVPRA